jgi:hypothetical protein
MKFTKFAEWKKTLLSERGIDYPDGRALYLYRLTEDEFLELEILLKKWLVHLLPLFGLARVADLSGFPELFVLYSAEWWRRRYDGSGFKWEPILHDLGAEPDEWSPSQRSDFVKHGLRGWRLKPRESGALRFIGSVAVQGGLPLKLLATARGGIGHLLSRVLQLASGSQVTQSDLLTWVESLQTMLPKSYRQSTIFTLLADVAWTVLMLKQEAGLTSSNDATAVLDKKMVGWRERFPLPVEDKHAQGMIEQLIRDAASVRIDRRSVFLPLERVLEQDDDGWLLRSRLVLPESVSFDQMAKLFDVTSDDLPRTADLSLIVNDNSQTTSLRRLAGHNSYRVERKPWGQSDDLAVCEHILRMVSPDGRVWSVTVTKGDALDADIPWVFIEKDSSYLLTKQGSGSVAAQEALVAMPKDWETEYQADSEVTKIGELFSPGRQVLRVRGVMKAFRDDGMSFRVRTGHAGAADESYIWGGNRYWLDFYSPSMAFRGIPNLYRFGEDNNRREVDGQPGCSVDGATGVSRDIGPVYLRYPATGNIKYRSRVLILPKGAGLEVIPFNAVSGEIQLKGWEAASVRVLTPGVEPKVRATGGDILLELTVETGQRVPDLVDLEVLWTHTSIPAKFRVPFPAKGVRAFDGDGNEIENEGLLAAQKLSGTRLLVSGGQINTRISMQITADGSREIRKYQLHVLPETLSLEIRLQDYSSDIQQLLSMDDSPDARVTVAILIQGVEMFAVKLARYASVLEREGDTVLLNTADLKARELDALQALPVYSIRLESPGDEAIPLIACNSEGVATGAWLFSQQKREPGSWLIYPGQEASIPFRPTLWPVDGDIGEGSQLSIALSIPEQEAREDAIDEVINNLSTDFGDSIWDEIEQLAGQVGHLPLATLDVWRRFANSPQGMAGMVLRFGNMPIGMIERFSQELPFAWETIPFVVWRTSMLGLQKQCMNTFGDESGLTVFKSHLDNRIKLLSSLNAALAYMLGIAGAEFLPESQREVNALKSSGKLARLFLFEGERSSLMTLRRTHAEDDWPTDFNSFFSSIDDRPLIMDYLYSQMSGFQTGVINMPLLLAVQAVTNQTDDWFADTANIHLLRKYRAFDPDWFDEAYNQTVAHCLADGLFQEEEK